MKEKKNILGAVSSVAVIMVLSRLLSLVSNQVYMSHYGANDLYLNIYSYAINVPNIIFTSIGTALSTVVIPIYVGHRAIGEHKEAKSFADNIISISLLLTSVLVVLGCGLSFVLPRFTGYAASPETYNFAVMALVTVMPVMFFYALNYIFQGMLQAVGRYKLPAFVSVPSSLVVIFYTIFFGDVWGVKGLLVATVIGLSLQAIILIPPLVSEGYRYTPKLKFNHPDIIKAGKMTVPVLLGVGAYQINMLYNNTMVASIDETMVTLFVFMQNITVQLVLAFVYSVTAVIYPRLTESASKGDMTEYKSMLSGILMSVSVLLIPMSFGFISVRETLLNLISAWGKITPDDITKGGWLVCAYAIGLLGIGFKEILDRALYSLGNTKVSAVNGVVIMVVNIVLSLVLVQIDAVGVYGIPLAYSIACLFGMGVLLVAIRKKVGPFAKGLGTAVLKSVLAAFVMLLCVEGLNFVIPAKADFVMRAIRLVVPVGAGVCVYVAMAFILKIKPVTEFLEKILKRGLK